MTLKMIKEKSMKKTVPVALFVYNRPEHTLRTLTSLCNNDMAMASDIYIFCDGPKKKEHIEAVSEVRRIVKNSDYAKAFRHIEIIESDKNRGLSASIINGVSELIDKFGAIIVLEDDLILSTKFLTYMNHALEYYKSDDRMWSVSGYTNLMPSLENYDEEVFFSPRSTSWGWGTWRDRWDTIDWEVTDYQSFKWQLKRRRSFNQGGADLSSMLDRQMNGKINSWAIRWCYNQFKQGKLSVYPTQTLVNNIGQDGSGTHCKNEIASGGISEMDDWRLIPPKLDREILKDIKQVKKIKTYKVIGNFIINVIFGELKRKK